MTQTQPDRLDQLESFIERMDRKLDAIAADVQDTKLDLRVFQARTEEQFKSLDIQLSDFKKTTEIQFKSTESQSSDLKKSTETQIADLKKSTETQFADLKKSTDTQFADIKIQLRGQDTRLWGFIVTLSLTVIGFLSKLAFFPEGKG